MGFESGVGVEVHDGGDLNEGCQHSRVGLEQGEEVWEHLGKVGRELALELRGNLALGLTHKTTTTTTTKFQTTERRRRGKERKKTCLFLAEQSSQLQVHLSHLADASTSLEAAKEQTGQDPLLLGVLWQELLHLTEGLARTVRQQDLTH